MDVRGGVSEGKTKFVARAGPAERRFNIRDANPPGDSTPSGCEGDGKGFESELGDTIVAVPPPTWIEADRLRRPMNPSIDDFCDLLSMVVRGRFCKHKSPARSTLCRERSIPYSSLKVDKQTEHFISKIVRDSRTQSLHVCQSSSMVHSETRSDKLPTPLGASYLLSHIRLAHQCRHHRLEVHSFTTQLTDEGQEGHGGSTEGSSTPFIEVLKAR